MAEQAGGEVVSMARDPNYLAAIRSAELEGLASLLGRNQIELTKALEMNHVLKIELDQTRAQLKQAQEAEKAEKAEKAEAEKAKPDTKTRAERRRAEKAAAKGKPAGKAPEPAAG